ncbi:MAG: tetratricopeptide repeat protein [Pseudomonadota bacterium]
MSAFSEALTFHKAGDLPAAEAAYRLALAEGESDRARGNLGLVLRGLGRADEAEAELRRACELAPHRATHFYNLGNLYWHTGRAAEAGDAYDAAFGLDPHEPGLRLNMGNAAILAGREAEGWALYDTRPERARSQANRLSFPEWRGEPLAGKRLFVWGEQGFGDEIFAARYFSGTGAASVTVASRPELADLIRQLGHDVRPMSDSMTIERHDYWALPLSLPRWATASTAPYFKAEGAAGGGVGVMWRGNAKPDPGRSLPEAQAARLLALPGAVSLQPEDSGARDFQETAAIIAGLDRVVTIDTSVAHLAGALGKPTLVLLQAEALDWRWRESSPGRSHWYPSIELRRQPRRGAWAPLIDDVIRELGG